MGRFLLRAFFCFCLLVAICESSVAAEPLTPAPSDDRFRSSSSALNLELGLDAGVRSDRLRWSIAGSLAGLDPNILSELEWSDVLSYQLTIGGRTQLGPHFYGSGHVSLAWIQSGSVRDSDYNSDNRTQEFSRSVCETNGDYLWDLVAGFGYPFSFLKRHLFLAPMAGFSIHRQSFRITNGQQIISENPSKTAIGPLSSRLNSLYSAMWQNLWVGCDLRYETGVSAWELSLKHYVLADYSAEADWNLRSDLQHPVSFGHEAQGQGFSVQLLWFIQLSRHLNMNLNINHIRLKTDSGLDAVYVADGRRITTRLNEVVWESNSVMVGIAYRF